MQYNNNKTSSLGSRSNPPQRRLITIHNKTNITKNKINQTKNNNVLLYELAENFSNIFDYLGIYEVLPKSATSQLFYDSINAWLANICFKFISNCIIENEFYNRSRSTIVIKPFTKLERIDINGIAKYY